MAIARDVLGYGSTTNKYVFAIRFTQPLSSAVRYECYDNNQTFPAVDTVTTTANAVFGKSAGEESMIALHDTTLSAPGATSWFPSAVRSNTGSMNLMEGQTSYVTQQGVFASAPNAGGTVFFNVQVKVPASAQTQGDNFGFDILARYTYTSTAPTVIWKLNDSQTGTDVAGSAGWAIATPGVVGIVHCRAATPTAGPYLADIPETGQQKTLVGIVAPTIV